MVFVCSDITFFLHARLVGKISEIFFQTMKWTWEAWREEKM